MSASRNYGNMYFMGTWSADVYYAYNEDNFNSTPVVQYGGSLYAAQATTTKGTNPATDTVGWTLII
jgi:hypothetical protein